MKRTAISGAAAIAAALAVVLSGCGSDTKTEPSATSASQTTTTTTSAKAAPPTSKMPPRDAKPPGPNPSIASYVAENNIQESPVKRGDPGSPTINLPSPPPGWKDAGADTPQWAYSAIIYTGPNAGKYTPSIVALVSKLTGNVDPQKIIDLAPGELNNLPGWKAVNTGMASTLSTYPAFQLAGTWTQDGQTKIVAQKTVVIPGSDGVYVLQLNADGLENQAKIVADATTIVDEQTTITP